MKTVTIPIKVEVPDDAKQVAVDENGEVWSTNSHPINSSGKDGNGFGVWVADGLYYWGHRCRVSNWKETLTEVKL